MEILAVIPARGGSKGIPKKNLQPINGIPLIAHSILNAKKSNIITRVVVSTDDFEIKRIASEYGAEVISRPPELSTDEASSETALLHVLEYLWKKEEYSPELLVFLQCTSPLTKSEDIDGTILKMINSGADSCFTVADFHYFLWEFDENGSAKAVNHDKRIRLRRQDKIPQFIETGSVYVMKTKEFKEVKHRFFGYTDMYIIPKERHFEIDDPIDLRIGQILMKEMKEDNFSKLPAKIDAVIFDFDGVFTDNMVYVDQEGKEAVMCSRSDGLSIELFRNWNIPLIILSKEKNDVVKARANKLNIEVLNGIDRKDIILSDICIKRSYDLKNIIYVGNDLNDIGCMQIVGCPVAVNDAYEPVKRYAKIVLHSSGGHGAVREILELINYKLKEDTHEHC